MKLTVTFDITDRFARILECVFVTPQQLLSQIKEKLDIIMASQAEFDAKITAANTALDEIAAAVAAEAEQIAAFIAANPTVDTSALDGVVTRLEGVNESISGVFEPPVEPGVPPVEPPVEP